MSNQKNATVSLSDEAFDIFQRTRPSAAQLQARAHLVQFVQECALDKMIAWTVAHANGHTPRNLAMLDVFTMFGSSACGSDLHVSDADVALLIHDINENQNDEADEKKHQQKQANAQPKKAATATAQPLSTVSSWILKSVRTDLQHTKISIPGFNGNHAYQPDFSPYNENAVQLLSNYELKEFKKMRKYRQHNNGYLMQATLSHPKRTKKKLSKKSWVKAEGHNPNPFYAGPLLRIKDPFQGVNMDLLVVSIAKKDNLLLTNKLMHFVLNFNYDSRIRVLIVNIKCWMKARIIPVPSYCAVLMAIKYLQMADPPILPVIEDGQCLENNKLKSGSQTNEMDLGQLLTGFFQFWRNFRWNHYEIDICRPGLIIRNKIQDTFPAMIRDPINRKFLCSKKINTTCLDQLVNNINTAWLGLFQNGSWNGSWAGILGFNM